MTAIFICVIINDDVKDIDDDEAKLTFHFWDLLEY